ncbi:MAG: DEAD/DEAH box helicase [Thiobacillus sp.]
MQLRPYQPPIIDSLRDGFRAGHVRQIMSASTGAGKSVVMMEMVRNAVEKGSRTMFICERRNLVDQFSAHLDSEHIDHGILMAKHWRFRPEAMVQVASAQTLERMESWPDFSIAFIDEIHASMRKSIVTMMEKRPTLKVVGATATPFHPLIAKYFTNVVSAPPMRELVNLGYLVPYRVFIAHEINTDGVKVIAGEWQKDELETRGRQIVGDIVMDYIRLSNEVFGRKSKAICFSCGIAHGAELAQSFAEAGINSVQLASGVDEEFKSEVLREFSKSDSSIDILISVDMLSRGFDQTDIEHVILARPLKKSFSQHVQMIGRGARSHDGKKLCVIQDNAGNWLRFADDWEEFYANGVSELVGKADAKPKKEPSKQEKERAKCPKCGSLWAPRSDTCLHCGHTRIRFNDVAALPGEMLELSAVAKTEKYSSEYKKAWYQGMLALLRNSGKNENRAYHLYREKFGIDPAWKKESGVITPEVVNYLKMANIAFSKRRAA